MGGTDTGQRNEPCMSYTGDASAAMWRPSCNTGGNVSLSAYGPRKVIERDPFRNGPHLGKSMEERIAAEREELESTKCATALRVMRGEEPVDSRDTMGNTINFGQP